jgi:large subunit ribosomal protein L9
MKVVLLKDIKGTGRAHTAVDVKDGHAINFLIPRRLAVPATAAVLKNAETRAAKAEEARVVSAKLIEERLAALAEERVVVKKKVTDKGSLYDGVDAKELAELVQIPVDAIDLEKPIKETGTFEIPVAFGEQFGKFTLVVEAE